jgi:hypothetical protein
LRAAEKNSAKKKQLKRESDKPSFQPTSAKPEHSNPANTLFDKAVNSETEAVIEVLRRVLTGQAVQEISPASEASTRGPQIPRKAVSSKIFHQRED